MPIHKNYKHLEDNDVELKNHVDKMYVLINNYAKENDIKLTYSDDAERFVEAIATYVVDSKD